MKKIIIILVIVAALGGLAYLIWWLNGKYGKPKDEKNTSDGSSGSGSTSGGSPSANSFASLPNGSFPLKKGQKSKFVYLLQQSLNQLGGNLSVDGDFGNKTESELKKQFNVTEVSIQLAVTIRNKLIAKNQSPGPAQAALNALIGNLSNIIPT